MGFLSFRINANEIVDASAFILGRQRSFLYGVLPYICAVRSLCWRGDAKPGGLTGSFGAALDAELAED